jgi:anaphase-promoting complex subunit 10
MPSSRRSPGVGPIARRQAQSAGSSRATSPGKPRLPLQELPVTPNGALLGHRIPTLRPTPSLDKENLEAVHTALESRRFYTLTYLHRLARQLQDISAWALGQGVELDPPHTDTTDSSSLALIRRARESMPAGDSDDSGSEPDLSVLAAARYRGELADLDITLPEEMEPEDTSVEDDMDVEAEEEAEEGEEQPPLMDPATLGLKEISNLGKFTVSSHKQGNGVEELRSDDLNLYWQ